MDRRMMTSCSAYIAGIPGSVRFFRFYVDSQRQGLISVGNPPPLLDPIYALLKYKSTFAYTVPQSPATFPVRFQ